MRLLPRPTLHRDVKQFIYNWIPEEDDLDLDWGHEKKLNGREEKRKKEKGVYRKKVMIRFTQPCSQARIKVRRKETRAKGRLSQKSRDKVHATRQSSSNQGSAKGDTGKKGRLSQK